MDIEVTEERNHDVLVLLPIGRLDSMNARSFESIVMEHISSTGLRVALLATRALQASKGQIVLCAMKKHIEEVFRISGFDRIISIKESRKAALDVFA